MSKPFALADEAATGFSNSDQYDQHRPSKAILHTPFHTLRLGFTSSPHPHFWSIYYFISMFLFQTPTKTRNVDQVYSGYPPEAVDKVLTHLGIANESNARIIDLGSGTGKFTELLVARPEKYEVVAVEPHEGMRGTLEKKNLGIEVLDGNSGSIPVKDGWGDALVAAQVSLRPRRLRGQVLITWEGISLVCNGGLVEGDSQSVEAGSYVWNDLEYR